MAIFGLLFVLGCLLIGTLLAIMIDQKVRAESALRTIYLYPYSMSFIVTGLVWQWAMNPGLGIQKSVRELGWESFTFDWVVDKDMAVYALVIAGVWQASGLVMALMLAGLRGVDQELWKASRVDGIPAWRAYVSIVLPLLRPMIITAVVLLAISVVKAYDLVVALTRGGPGIASEVPAKFIMDNLFERQNIALATAASTIMLITVLAVISPWLYSEYFRRSGRQARMNPNGPRPQSLTPSRVGIYAFLIVAALFFLTPLWIMVMTSLKTMPEIRQGNIFAWPRELTIAAWSEAWASVCTGLKCEGISVGFWNSVKILVPSVILSIAVGRHHRLCPVLLAGQRRQSAFRLLCWSAPSSPIRSSSIPWCASSRFSASTIRSPASSSSTSSSACRS